QADDDPDLADFPLPPDFPAQQTLTPVKPYLAVLTATLLSACTLGPDFVPPSANTQPSYVSAQDQAMPADQQLALGKPADAQWWKQFQSPALNGLIEQAASESRDLTAARARLAQAQEQITVARAALLPQVNLGAAIGEQNYSLGLQNLQTPLTSVL